MLREKSRIEIMKQEGSSSAFNSRHQVLLKTRDTARSESPSAAAINDVITARL